MKLEKLVAVARQHAATEASGDLETLMATLEGSPVYEFLPLGRQFVGMAQTRRFYEHLIADFQPRIEATHQLSEAVGEAGLIMEFTLRLRLEGAAQPSLHRVIATLVFGKEKLSGERIYADTPLLRAMLGPLWDELQPIDLSF